MNKRRWVKPGSKIVYVGQGRLSHGKFTRWINLFGCEIRDMNLPWWDDKIGKIIGDE